MTGERYRGYLIDLRNRDRCAMRAHQQGPEGVVAAQGLERFRAVLVSKTADPLNHQVVVRPGRLPALEFRRHVNDEAGDVDLLPDGRHTESERGFADGRSYHGCA